MQRRQPFAPLDNYRYGHDNNIHLDICPKCLAPFEDENLFFEHISVCEENNNNNNEDEYDEEYELEHVEEVIENQPIHEGEIPEEIEEGEIVEEGEEGEEVEPVYNIQNISNELNRLQNLVNDNNIDNRQFQHDMNNLRNVINRYYEERNIEMPLLRRYNRINPEEKYEQENMIEQKQDYESYDCRICLMRLTTRASLENHFNLRHNNYADLMRLTEMSKPNFGFPGFEMLKLINMIDEVNLLKLRESECNICTEEFSYITHEEKTMPTKSCCDLDIITSKRKHLKRFINCDLLLNKKYKNTIEITHTYLKEYTEELEIIKPYSMFCCDKIICNRCIKRQYSETGNLNCVYCKFDHTKYDKDYITVIEPHTYYNKKQWAEWWANVVI